VNKASLQFGNTPVWEGVSLDVVPGEFIAVLGPNGSGKSSLLKVLLGQYRLNEGEVRVSGSVGYIPQQQTFDIHTPLRGRDLVSFGLDGNRWGLGGILPRRQPTVEDVLTAVGASEYASVPVGRLSGGQQQRLRVAQALVGKPQVLLCDEPLLSLDLASQHAVADLINDQRKQGTAVLFVTHDINPVLPFVDRVLYLAGGRWKLGKPREVLTSKVLSKLYSTDVDVLEVRGRLIVVTGDEGHTHHDQEAGDE
jgi:zinc/manganese transport system ATP-binding protein